jgi:hypothetical protein
LFHQLQFVFKNREKVSQKNIEISELSLYLYIYLRLFKYSGFTN